MAYDAVQTRTNLLDAAFNEFAERGFAGARISRIAEVASANKQAIYLYFTSKEGLFDAVLANRLGILADAVPFTAEDLPGYIAALFDHFVEDPRLLRLTQWKDLERPEPSQPEVDSHVSKAQTLAQTHRLGDAEGMDILMLTLSMAKAWPTTGLAIRDIGQDDETRRRQHRRALVAAVATLVAPRSGL